MTEFLHIKPAPGRRVAFARWAVAQTPKLRTVAADTFAVPAALFVHAPEDALIGAMVNGRRYVSPVEDADHGTPAPGQRPVTGPAGPVFREAAPDVFDGEDPDRALPMPGDFYQPESYGPEFVRLVQGAPAGPWTLVGDDGTETYVPDGAGAALGGESSDPSPGDVAAFACEVCARGFTSHRGLTMHRRQAHPED